MCKVERRGKRPWGHHGTGGTWGGATLSLWLIPTVWSIGRCSTSLLCKLVGNGVVRKPLVLATVGMWYKFFCRTRILATLPQALLE